MQNFLVAFTLFGRLFSHILSVGRDLTRVQLSVVIFQRYGDFQVGYFVLIQHNSVPVLLETSHFKIGPNWAKRADNGSITKPLHFELQRDLSLSFINSQFTPYFYPFTRGSGNSIYLCGCVVRDVFTAHINMEKQFCNGLK